MKKTSKKVEEIDNLEGITPDSLTIEGADPSNASSYKNIMLREKRWARTDSGWQSVAAIALIVFLCIGAMMLMILLDRGWDGLVALLGY
ncbi:MAG TPA: hypothetical protein VM409_00760 [Chloroflexia bacterium]|nr:hypothetical protein [Chloroflexia bacterium]